MNEKGVDDKPVDVHVPDEPPEVTPTVARALLGILIEVTTVAALEETPDDG